MGTPDSWRRVVRIACTNSNWHNVRVDKAMKANQKLKVLLSLLLNLRASPQSDNVAHYLLRARFNLARWCLVDSER